MIIGGCLGASIISILQHFIICPIFYWIAASLDDFNGRLFHSGDKWWYRPYFKTLKDFVNARKETDTYRMCFETSWIPGFGLISNIFYFIIVLLGTICAWLLLIVKYIIVPICLFIYDYFLKYIIKYLKYIIDITYNKGKIKNIFNIIKIFNENTMNNFLNIKLNKI